MYCHRTQIERNKCTCRHKQVQGDPILNASQDLFHERTHRRSICNKMTNTVEMAEWKRLELKRNGRFSDQGEQQKGDKAEGGCDRPILNHCG